MQLFKIKPDSIGGVSAEKMAKTFSQSYVDTLYLEIKPKFLRSKL